MSDLVFSSTVISDGLQALTRALDSDPSNPGRIRIYSDPQPSPGQAPGAATLLALATFPKPSLDNVTGYVLTLNLPATVLVAASGVASWARLENGAGVFVADAVVGLPGSGKPVEIDNGALVPTLTIYAGGDLTIGLARLTQGAPA